ncbi:MAG: hypothetical protein O3A51_04365 [Verrucomicrobia bacterium]|nr:hypothetical protein [Verrucomicrobiota bacterium]
MKTTLTVFVALVIVFSGTTPGLAEGQDGNPRRMQPDNPHERAFQQHGPQQQGGGGDELIGKLINSPKLAAELDLTEDQIAKLRDGMFEFQKKKVQTRANLELAAIEQARLLTEKDVDRAALMKAVEKTGAIRTDMAKMQIEGLLLMRETLTEEQHAKLREMMQRRRRGGGDDDRADRRRAFGKRDAAKRSADGPRDPQ